MILRAKLEFISLWIWCFVIESNLGFLGLSLYSFDDAMMYPHAKDIPMTMGPNDISYFSSDPWYLHDLSSPIFLKHFSEKVTWVQAERICQKNHGHLVKDGNGNEETIREYLSSIQTSELDSDYIWIGLYQMSPFDRFQWIDDVTSLGLYNFNPKSDTDFDEMGMCVSVSMKQSYKWSTRFCNGPDKAGFVCQIPVPAWMYESPCGLQEWVSSMSNPSNVNFGNLLKVEYFPHNDTAFIAYECPTFTSAQGENSDGRSWRREVKMCHFQTYYKEFIQEGPNDLKFTFCNPTDAEMSAKEVQNNSHPNGDLRQKSAEEMSWMSQHFINQSAFPTTSTLNTWYQYGERPVGENEDGESVNAKKDEDETKSHNLTIKTTETDKSKSQGSSEVKTSSNFGHQSKIAFQNEKEMEHLLENSFKVSQQKTLENPLKKKMTKWTNLYATRALTKEKSEASLKHIESYQNLTTKRISNSKSSSEFWKQVFLLSRKLQSLDQKKERKKRSRSKRATTSFKAPPKYYISPDPMQRYGLKVKPPSTSYLPPPSTYLPPPRYNGAAGNNDNKVKDSTYNYVIETESTFATGPTTDGTIPDQTTTLATNELRGPGSTTSVLGNTDQSVNQAPTSTYSVSGIQEPSSTYSVGSADQSGNQAPTSTYSASGAQEPSSTYSVGNTDQSRNQGPASTYSASGAKEPNLTSSVLGVKNQSGHQAPSSTYSASGAQEPSTTYSVGNTDQSGSQAPTSTYSASGAQEPSTTYSVGNADQSGSQAPTSTYSASGAQEPSTTYSVGNTDQSGSQAPTSTYSASGAQEPSSVYSVGNTDQLGNQAPSSTYSVSGVQEPGSALDGTNQPGTEVPASIYRGANGTDQSGTQAPSSTYSVPQSQGSGSTYSTTRNRDTTRAEIPSSTYSVSQSPNSVYSLRSGGRQNSIENAQTPSSLYSVSPNIKYYVRNRENERNRHGTTTANGIQAGGPNSDSQEDNLVRIHTENELKNIALLKWCPSADNELSLRICLSNDDDFLVQRELFGSLEEIPCYLNINLDPPTNDKTENVFCLPQDSENIPDIDPRAQPTNCLTDLNNLELDANFQILPCLPASLDPIWRSEVSQNMLCLYNNVEVEDLTRPIHILRSLEEYICFSDLGEDDNIMNLNEVLTRSGVPLLPVPSAEYEILSCLDNLGDSSISLSERECIAEIGQFDIENDILTKLKRENCLPRDSQETSLENIEPRLCLKSQEEGETTEKSLEETREEGSISERTCIIDDNFNLDTIEAGTYACLSDSASDGNIINLSPSKLVNKYCLPDNENYDDLTREELINTLPFARGAVCFSDQQVGRRNIEVLPEIRLCLGIFGERDVVVNSRVCMPDNFVIDQDQALEEIFCIPKEEENNIEGKDVVDDLAPLSLSTYCIPLMDSEDEISTLVLSQNEVLDVKNTKLGVRSCINLDKQFDSEDLSLQKKVCLDTEETSVNLTPSFCFQNDQNNVIDSSDKEVKLIDVADNIKKLQCFDNAKNGQENKIGLTVRNCFTGDDSVESLLCPTEAISSLQELEMEVRMTECLADGSSIEDAVLFVENIPCFDSIDPYNNELMLCKSSTGPRHVDLAIRRCFSNEINGALESLFDNLMCVTNSDLLSGAGSIQEDQFANQFCISEAKPVREEDNLSEYLCLTDDSQLERRTCINENEEVALPTEQFACFPNSIRNNEEVLTLEIKTCIQDEIHSGRDVVLNSRPIPRLDGLQTYQCFVEATMDGFAMKVKKERMCYKSTNDISPGVEVEVLACQENDSDEDETENKLCLTKSPDFTDLVGTRSSVGVGKTKHSICLVPADEELALEIRECNNNENGFEDGMNQVLLPCVMSENDVVSIDASGSDFQVVSCNMGKPTNASASLGIEVDKRIHDKTEGILQLCIETNEDSSGTLGLIPKVCNFEITENEEPTEILPCIPLDMQNIESEFQLTSCYSNQSAFLINSDPTEETTTIAVEGGNTKQILELKSLICLGVGEENGEFGLQMKKCILEDILLPSDSSLKFNLLPCLDMDVTSLRIELSGNPFNLRSCLSAPQSGSVQVELPVELPSYAVPDELTNLLFPTYFCLSDSENSDLTLERRQCSPESEDLNSDLDDNLELLSCTMSSDEQDLIIPKDGLEFDLKACIQKSEDIGGRDDGKEILNLLCFNPIEENDSQESQLGFSARKCFRSDDLIEGIEDIELVPCLAKDVSFPRVSLKEGSPLSLKNCLPHGKNLSNTDEEDLEISLTPDPEYSDKNKMFLCISTIAIDDNEPQLVVERKSCKSDMSLNESMFMSTDLLPCIQSSDVGDFQIPLSGIALKLTQCENENKMSSLMSMQEAETSIQVSSQITVDSSAPFISTRNEKDPEQFYDTLCLVPNLQSLTIELTSKKCIQTVNHLESYSRYVCLSSDALDHGIIFTPTSPFQSFQCTEEEVEDKLQIVVEINDILETEDWYLCIHQAKNNSMSLIKRNCISPVNGDGQTDIVQCIKGRQNDVLEVDQNGIEMETKLCLRSPSANHIQSDKKNALSAVQRQFVTNNLCMVYKENGNSNLALEARTCTYVENFLFEEMDLETLPCLDENQIGNNGNKLNLMQCFSSSFEEPPRMILSMPHLTREKQSACFIRDEEGFGLKLSPRTCDEKEEEDVEALICLEKPFKNELEIATGNNDLVLKNCKKDIEDTKEDATILTESRDSEFETFLCLSSTLYGEPELLLESKECQQDVLIPRNDISILPCIPSRFGEVNLSSEQQDLKLMGCKQMSDNVQELKLVSIQEDFVCLMQSKISSNIALKTMKCSDKIMSKEDFGVFACANIGNNNMNKLGSRAGIKMSVKQCYLPKEEVAREVEQKFLSKSKDHKQIQDVFCLQSSNSDIIGLAQKSCYFDDYYAPSNVILEVLPCLETNDLQLSSIINKELKKMYCIKDVDEVTTQTPLIPDLTSLLSSDEIATMYPGKQEDITLQPDLIPQLFMDIPNPSQALTSHHICFLDNGDFESRECLSKSNKLEQSLENKFEYEELLCVESEERDPSLLSYDGDIPELVLCQPVVKASGLRSIQENILLENLVKIVQNLDDSEMTSQDMKKKLSNVIENAIESIQTEEEASHILDQMIEVSKEQKFEKMPLKLTADMKRDLTDFIINKVISEFNEKFGEFKRKRDAASHSEPHPEIDRLPKIIEILMSPVPVFYL